MHPRDAARSQNAANPPRGSQAGVREAKRDREMGTAGGAPCPGLGTGQAWGQLPSLPRCPPLSILPCPFLSLAVHPCPSLPVHLCPPLSIPPPRPFSELSKVQPSRPLSPIVIPAPRAPGGGGGRPGRGKEQQRLGGAGPGAHGRGDAGGAPHAAAAAREPHRGPVRAGRPRPRRRVRVRGTPKLPFLLLLLRLTPALPSANPCSSFFFLFSQTPQLLHSHVCTNFHG